MAILYIYLIIVNISVGPASIYKLLIYTKNHLKVDLHTVLNGLNHEDSAIK